jgi:ABC-type bacteriocin/lantibiotic exporter with double-glycine peptidase domain
MTKIDVAITPFLSVVPQRSRMDCGVACLAMLCGVSYERALLATRGPVLDQGMRTRQIQATARRLGRALTFCRTVDLENDTGLLAVRSVQWPHDHLVVLKDGLIVDTDASLWDVDVFLSAYDATVLSILR